MQILQTDAAAERDGEAVPGDVGEIGGVAEQAAQATPTAVPASTPVHTTAPRNIQPGPTVDMTLFD